MARISSSFGGDDFGSSAAALSAADNSFLGYIPYAAPPPGTAAGRKRRAAANGGGVGSGLPSSIMGKLASWFNGGAGNSNSSAAAVPAAATPGGGGGGGFFSPQPREPSARRSTKKRRAEAAAKAAEEEASYYQSLVEDANGNPIGDAVKSADDGLPIRDFIYSSAVGRLYYSTRDEICAPFGFYHGQRVVIRKGPLQGLRVVIVGVHGGQLHGIFEGETEASPFLRCYNFRQLMAEYDLEAISKPRAVKLQPLTLPFEVPERVHNFLRFAPDLTMEISLDQNVDDDEKNGADGEKSAAAASSSSAAASGKKSAALTAAEKRKAAAEEKKRKKEEAAAAAAAKKKATAAAAAMRNTRRSISFADGPELEIASPKHLVKSAVGTARSAVLPTGGKRARGGAGGDEDEDEDDTNTWLLNQPDYDDDEDEDAAEGTDSSSEEDESSDDEDEGSSTATPALSSVNPFIPYTEPTTPRRGLVIVYLTPTYALAHNGSVGWSGEAMQPISGAGNVPRFPLFNFNNSAFVKAKKEIQSALAEDFGAGADFNGKDVVSALDVQKQYLSQYTQPLLASISATVIVPLVLSFKAVEALASTVEGEAEDDDDEDGEGAEVDGGAATSSRARRGAGGTENINAFLDKVVAAADDHQRRTQEVVDVARSSLGIKTAFDLDAEFLAAHQNAEEDE